MRKIAAHYIFPVTDEPIKNGTLVFDDDGSIIEIIKPVGKFTEQAGVEFHSGILIPAFVNAHCHLELSHLAGKVLQKTGLPAFIEQMFAHRATEVSENYIQKKIELADFLMYKNGINAVADISNTANSFDVKAKSKIVYHTLIEVAASNSKLAASIYKNAETIQILCNKTLSPKCNITPHAAYSVSNQLFELIKGGINPENSIISIHNQESRDENELIKNGTGQFCDLFDKFGIDYSGIVSGCANSLQSIITKLPELVNKLLIHNTFTTQNDIDFVTKTVKNINELFWVMCVNSNLFIENSLPDIEMFVKNRLQICLGTDSLASNNELSILSEIKTIEERFPQFSFNEILKWACLNGAKALKVDNVFGSFEIGKKPGILLIRNFDYKNMHLNNESKIQRIM